MCFAGLSLNLSTECFDSIFDSAISRRLCMIDTITKITIIKDRKRELQNKWSSYRKKRTLQAYDGDAKQEFSNSCTNHMNNEKKI